MEPEPHSHGAENESAAWEQAARFVESLLIHHAKPMDALQDNVFGFFSPDSRYCQHLCYGVARNRLLLESLLLTGVMRRPRPRLLARLLLGAFEIMDSGENPGRTARTVHFTVERIHRALSKRESQFANALLRRFPQDLEAFRAKTVPEDASALSFAYSHPEWLVKRWISTFTLDVTRRLLEWNQLPAPVYLHHPDALGAVPPGWEESGWPGFFRIRREGWPAALAAVREGVAYFQDPGTRHAVALLNVQPGETVLDLCAAPGGKSWALATAGAGTVFSVDRRDAGSPARGRRWRENAGVLPGRIQCIEADLADRASRPALEQATGCRAFSAVLLDTPCSNTGVIRRKPDIRWRLEPESFTRMAGLQLRLLKRAAEWVAENGRLVYSTCSIEPVENQEIVDAFLRTEAGSGYRLVEKREFHPWIDGHDGGGAYLLRRVCSPIFRQASGKENEQD